MARSVLPRLVAAQLGLAICGGLPVHAADPVFPPGSRVGLVPPPGLVVSKEFKGFEDRANSIRILITEYPASAYSDLENGVAAEQMQKQGITVENREPVALATGPAFLVVGHQEGGGTSFRRLILFSSTPDFTAIVSVQVPEDAKASYPEAVMRTTLESFTIRAKAPVEERLAAMPFTLRDLAGFRVTHVLPGTTVLLTEGPSDDMEVAEQPLVLISIVLGVAPPANERDRYARTMFAATIPSIRDVRLMRAEPLRMGNHLGYEIVAEAKDGKTRTDIIVAQWLRFSSNGQLRVAGMARKEDWAAFFPRLRAVRDGVDVR